MIKDCLSIVFPYLDWASDQRYLVLTNSPEYRSEGTSRCQYIKKVWKKYTLFEKHIEYGGWHYYANGKHHRDDDLPATEWNDGDKEWLRNGKLHRDNDLPAIEYKGLKEWYKNGVFIKMESDIVITTNQPLYAVMELNHGGSMESDTRIIVMKFEK